MFKKKFYILLFCDKSSNNIYNSHYLLINKLKKKFKNFLLINYYYLNNNENFEKPKKDKIPVNIFEPKTFFDLKEFSKNKDVICILIDNFGTNLPKIKTYFMFKKINFRLIKLKDVHSINQKDKIILGNFYKSFRYNADKIIYEWILIILRFLKILPKFEIYFLSDKKEFKKINNNFFKRNFSSFNKIEIINSKTHDSFTKNKNKIDNKYIVLLDDFFDHPSSVKLRGKISDAEINEHYNLLNKFLKKIENYFTKEIIVCIHPRDNLKKKKKIFKNFKVFQFQTQRYIFRSFLILFFDTSSILDGILLKKKMLAIYSNFNDDNVKFHIKGYKKNLNIQNQQISNLNFTKKEILNKSKIPIQNFSRYINSYINTNGKRLGIEKITTLISKM